MHVHLVQDRARFLPDVARPEAVTSACIWFCRYRSLKALAACTGLQELKVADFPDEDLEAIGRLAGLHHLSLMHLPRVRDLEPLRGLANLRTLSLAVLPGWEGKRRQTVASLEPIAALPQLRHLELFGVGPPDLSLAALEVCPHLLSARFSQYPRREVQRWELVTQIPADPAPAPAFEARMI